MLELLIPALTSLASILISAMHWSKTTTSVKIIMALQDSMGVILPYWAILLQKIYTKHN
jgi:hypothetical protein